MKRTTRYLAVSMAAAGLALGVTAGRAQLVPSLPGMPSLPGGLPSVGRGISSLADPVIDRVDAASRATVRQLEQVRRATFAQLVRDHPDAIALDPMGFPARAGEVVVDAPSDALLATVGRLGFTVIERDDVLGVGFVRLRVPPGQSLKAALGILQKLGGEVSADQLHLPSGAGAPAALTAVQGGTGRGTMVGVIDGGAEGAAMARGFATGAPRANDHGTAVASLIAGSNGIRGALPGARIASADVYGSDPAGGNATAIAKALGWLVEQRVSVATISLVGPANPLLARVVAAAQKRGLIIVAAVGNNGPAAPPAYPASYLGVIAVTGVDGRGRPLIEAGRASHLDYAAPGADMLAAGVGGRRFKVRGTSFAAPLVAGRVAAAYPSLDPGRIRAALADVDAEAKKNGRRNEEKFLGRGMVCADCRTQAQ
ncbi:S8 family serine peptidase [Sphingomonas yabuuchiae]|uniref:Subtilisin family serine protease n=2 Tax=Sphingomonas yabuuchiae TaxID=172044 RepID=A0ABR6K5Z1_9SPHN|nr:S8 family serine peptidase [Sphingomonas yabuuchiae]MBB4608496.1 subtilisin family serine protease [Sphingomonas yabuuchiae]